MFLLEDKESHVPRTLEPQSYNHKEHNSANNLKKYGPFDFSLVRSSAEDSAEPLCAQTSDSQHCGIISGHSCYLRQDPQSHQ